MDLVILDLIFRAYEKAGDQENDKGNDFYAIAELVTTLLDRTTKQEVVNSVKILLWYLELGDHVSIDAVKRNRFVRDEPTEDESASIYQMVEKAAPFLDDLATLILPKGEKRGYAVAS